MHKDNEQIIADALRQAATHSPDKETRSVCETALAHPGMPAYLMVSQQITCQYAQNIKRLVMDHWLGRDLSRHWLLR